MSQIFNTYCDESGHMENDAEKVMVLGAVWRPLEKMRAIPTLWRGRDERDL
jgi:hypothetical protein